MRKLLLFLLVLCYAPELWATTTVTGNIKTLGTGNVTTGAYVRFWLRGCSGNQPRINGTALIGPTAGGVFYFDMVANASGAISGTLYSTRDSTGLLAGEIECGGSKTSEWYGMQVYQNGRGGPETPIHAMNGVALDISTVSPLVTTPNPAAPPGSQGPQGPAGATGPTGSISAAVGPSPWTDITASPYNARAVASFGTTGTINATSTSLTLGAASSFINGDGIAIIGAGATNTLATPSCAVTPVAPVGALDSGVTLATPGASGSDTYEMVADDGNGGITAHSATCSTSTEQTLGFRKLTNCSLSRAVPATNAGDASGFSSLVTVSSCTANSGSSIAELAHGEVIRVSGASDDTFNGWFSAVTITGSTSVTYYQGWLANQTQTTTGAEIDYWNCNRISDSSSPTTSVWEDHVFKNVSGTETYIGSTLPWPGFFTTATYTDAGAVLDCGTTYTPTDGSVAPPWWVPATTPSASAQNDFLVTTISAGAGTTSVTVANAATNSVSGNAVRFDNTPALKAALASLSTPDGYVLIPHSSNGLNYVFNSPFTFSGFRHTLWQANAITLNAPWQWGTSTVQWYGKWQSNNNAGLPGSIGTAVNVSCSVSPCVFTSYTNNPATNIWGVGFIARKNGVGLLLDGPATADIEYNAFSFNSPVANSYMGALMVWRQPHGLGGGTSHPVISNNAFASDSLLGNGSTAAGLLFIGANQDITLNRNFLNARGIGWDALDTGEFTFHASGIYTQNQVFAPLIMEQGLVTSCDVNIDDVVEDTSGQPEVATLGTAAFALGSCPGRIVLSNTIASINFHFVTGGPVFNLEFPAGTGCASTAIIPCKLMGQNWNYSSAEMISGAGGLSNYSASNRQYFVPPGNITGTHTISGANATDCSGFVSPPGGINIGNIEVNIQTADGSNNSDIGIYAGSFQKSTTTLVGDIGAQHLGSTGAQKFPFAQGRIHVPEGRAYICLTSVGTTVTLNMLGASPTMFNIGSVSSVTSGGALNSSFTAPADGFTSGSTIWFMLAP